MPFTFRFTGTEHETSATWWSRNGTRRFDGVSHLHPIGEIVQDEIRQNRFGIDVEHLIQAVAAFDVLRERQPIQRGHQRLKLPHAHGEIVAGIKKFVRDTCG